MPKRNVVIIVASVIASLIAWAARERGGYGHRFGELVTAIERNYIRDVDSEGLFSAAVAAAVSRLDEHSAYLVATDRAELEATLDQEFAGVGLELSIDAASRQPVVMAPVFGGPGWRAGIVPGDRIVAIDGEPTAGRPLRDAVTRLRGEAGAGVRLVVAPVNSEPATLDPAAGPADHRVREVSLIREAVAIETVQGDRRGESGGWQWMLEGEPGVAYVRIESFGERTADEFTTALDQLAGEADLDALIIDLRGNPGGLVRSAVAVCDSLLDEGVILETRSRRTGGGETAPVPDIRLATAGSSARGVPLIVLVDGLTASAAEIVAACLQDSGGATVVGSRTFGKGTMQSLIPLSDGRGLLKLTTAEYLRPSREPIHREPQDGDDASWGVRPDPGCEVTPTAESLERLRKWQLARSFVPLSGGSTATVRLRPLPREIDAVLSRGLEIAAAVRARNASAAE